MLILRWRAAHRVDDQPASRRLGVACHGRSLGARGASPKRWLDNVAGRVRGDRRTRSANTRSRRCPPAAPTPPAATHRPRPSRQAPARCASIRACRRPVRQPRRQGYREPDQGWQRRHRGFRRGRWKAPPVRRQQVPPVSRQEVHGLAACAGLLQRVCPHGPSRRRQRGE